MRIDRMEWLARLETPMGSSCGRRIVRCQFISHGLCRAAREADRCQLPPVAPTALVEEAAAQPDAHGLSCEAGGCWLRLLGAHVGIP